MDKERLKSLGETAQRLSKTNAKKEGSLPIIDGIIGKKELPLEKLIRVAETRSAVRQSIGEITAKLASIHSQMELLRLDRIREMVAQGILTPTEAKPYLDRFTQPESLSKAIPTPKTRPEELIYLPTLKIDRETGDVTVIKEGETSLVSFGGDIAALQAFLALAENPSQPLNCKTITEIVTKAGYRSKSRPASSAMNKVRKALEQTKNSFQFISRSGTNHATYTLHANVEFVNKEKQPIEEVTFDKQERVLTINKKSINLSEQEALIVGHFYDRRNQQIPGSELAKILTDVGVKTAFRAVIFNIEKKYGDKIFRRIKIKGRNKILWSLDVADKKEEAESITQKIESVNPDILTEEETSLIMRLIDAKDKTKIVFDKKNQIMFRSPKWINEYALPINQEDVLDREDLRPIREKLLRKITGILQKEHTQGQVICNQPNCSAWLLLWMSDENNLPEGTKTAEKALTLAGLIKFLLSDGESTTTTSQELLVENHEAIYYVPPEDVLDIKSAGETTVAASGEEQAQQEPSTVNRPVVENVVFSAPKPVILTPKETDNHRDKKLNRREQLRNRVLPYINALREKQIKPLIKNKGLSQTQVPVLVPEISAKHIQKYVQNGSIKLVGQESNTFLPIEEVILLMMLKDSTGLTKRQINDLRKAIKTELEKSA